MPELPEVEVTRRGLAPSLQGALVQSVWLGKPLRWPLGCQTASLVGRQIQAVRRRGKYLLLDLDRGLLLLHLGMSGSLLLAEPMPPRGVHDHFDMQTSRGTLRLHDPRRFSAVVYSDHESIDPAHKLLAHLGPEPLSDQFSVEAFTAGLRKSRVPIKPLLLSGKLVVGVGNIYACEVLFLSGIAPATPAAQVTPAQALALHAAIRQVLQEAVRLGGTTLRDFRNTDGMPGHFQHAAKVYGRAGLPCLVCATPIQSMRQAQRSTYFCPHCQA